MRRGRLTQEQLARKIGITRTSVINIEKGRQQVLVHTLVGIAGALDIPPGALIPSHDDFSVRLKDATKKGRDWILTTIASLEEK